MKFGQRKMKKNYTKGYYYQKKKDKNYINYEESIKKIANNTPIIYFHKGKVIDFIDVSMIKSIVIHIAFRGSSNVIDQHAINQNQKKISDR